MRFSGEIFVPEVSQSVSGLEHTDSIFSQEVNARQGVCVGTTA